MTSPKHKGAQVAKGWNVLTPEQVANGLAAGRFDQGTGWILAEGEEKLPDGSVVDYSLQIGIDYHGKITITILIGHNDDNTEVVLESGKKFPDSVCPKCGQWMDCSC